MKISYNWLKTYVPLDVSAEELPKHLLKLGFEVSETQKLGAGFTGVVVGKVLKADKHPNADRLKLCQVSDGDETFSVVCGAPNVAEGQHIAFARIGAKLPGDFKIKKTKIRGEISHGMICSAKELDLPENGSGSTGILVLSKDSTLGEDYGRMLGDPDVVLDVDITPNRPDCLSHIGLARELAIHFNKEFSPPSIKKDASSGPASLPVKVADCAECGRYRGILIEGITVAPSPAWLADRLKAIGLRPINNIADITNFVLHETGQPLHAFDADALTGGRISVRDAKDGEKISALDGKQYALTEDNLVIADGKGPVAIAGVIGGKDSSVTDKTTRIFLECAYFKPARVRRSAKRLAIRTDSSYRFERGTDINGIPDAAQRAVDLIVELGGGTAGPASDTQPSPPLPKGITTTAERINQILGADYPEERITAVLKAIADHTGEDAKTLTLYPPSYRIDLETPWDLAEEIGRHLGFGAVPYGDAPIRLSAYEPTPLRDELQRLRSALVGLGYFEAYNYDFLSEAELRKHYGETDWQTTADASPRLLNPISEDWKFLRQSLLPGLLRNTALNFNHGTVGLRLFEIGRTYKKDGDTISERTHVAAILAGPAQASAHWASPQQEPDFAEVKGIAEAILAQFKYRFKDPQNTDTAYHPKACLDICKGKTPVGRFGLLHPTLLRAWDLEGRTVAGLEFEVDALIDAPVGAKKLDTTTVEKALHAKGDAPTPQSNTFKPFSTFPSSSRDISILIEDIHTYADIERGIMGAKAADLKKIDLIDLFTGKGIPEGKKSLTIRLTFGRNDRTLRDEEVHKQMDLLLAALNKKCGAELRG